MSSLQNQDFISAVKAMLRETFVASQGYYLDSGTSLFETLATIDAQKASIPVGGRCATLAAQIKHIAFYLDVIETILREGDAPKADWNEIWQTVSVVTPDEWEAIQNELRGSYQRVNKRMDEKSEWADAREIGEAMALVVHSAYHLGEIRQALCILSE